MFTLREKKKKTCVFRLFFFSFFNSNKKFGKYTAAIYDNHTRSLIIILLLLNSRVLVQYFIFVFKK